MFYFGQDKLEPKWLNLLQPEVAIKLTSKVQDKTQQITKIESDLDLTYIIDHDGAITWTPRMGFQSNFDLNKYN